MATYIQGVQDKVEKVRPPQPNLQFEAQLLQARQAKYDAGHKKLSDMYGKILNAGLTRQGNIQARDDFFKLIDQDLKKISGMDLSLDSNVSKAQRVFSQVYENDYLVKDMVWTKNFQNEMKRAEAFKNCVDPETCGGQYWDEGVKAMQYKRQEFAQTDNADSLTFSNASYVPYHNLMEKALEHAEKAGLDITQDVVQGDYKYTYKNGHLILNPLTDLFSKLYGENPAYQEQFEVQAYNARKDWASGQVAAGNFKDMQEAEVGYITQRSEQLTNAVNDAAASIGADASLIDKQLANLTEKINAGKVKENSAEALRYQQLSQLKVLSDQANSFAEVSKTAMKKANDHKIIRNIGAQLDKGTALALMDKEVKGIAQIMSNKDASITMEADEFAKMRVKHMYDVSLENLKSSNKMQEEYYKAQLGHSSYKKDDDILSVDKIIQKEFNAKFGAEGITGTDIKENAEKRYGKDHSSQDMNDQSKVGKGNKYWEDPKNWHNKEKNQKWSDQELKNKKPDDIRDKQLARDFMEAQNIYRGKQRKRYEIEHKAKKLDEEYKTLGQETQYYNVLKERGASSFISSGNNTTGGEGGSGNFIPPPPSKGGGAAYYPNTGVPTQGQVPQAGGQAPQAGGYVPQGSTPAPQQRTRTEDTQQERPSEDKNTSTSGIQDGEFSYNNNDYKKKGDTWYKKIDGKYKELTAGNVEERVKVLEKSANRINANVEKKDFKNKWSNADFRKKRADGTTQLNNEILDFVAEGIKNTSVSEQTKEFYQNIVDNGGVDYIEKMSKKDKDLLYNNIGKRMDLILSKQKGQNEDGKIWRPGGEFVKKIKKSAEEWEKFNIGHRERMYRASMSITENYVQSLNEKDDTDEIKSLQNKIERFIIKNADIDKWGEVKYKGKSYGFIYADRDGQTVRMEGGRSDWSKKDQRRNLNYIKLHPVTKENVLDFGKIKKFFRTNESKELSKEIANTVVINRVDETQGSYFNTKVKGGATAYEKDVAEFTHNQDIHKGLAESKTKSRKNLVKAMGEYLAKNETDFIEAHMADDVIDANGNFNIPKGISSSEENMEILKDAYEDAMKAVYKSGHLGKYNVEAGSMSYKTVKAFDVDMSDKGHRLVQNIEEIVDQARLAGKGEEGISTGNIKIEGIEGEEIDILNNIINGKYDISEVNFNPIGGVSPRALGLLEEGAKQSKWKKSKYENIIEGAKMYKENDYSRLEIVMTGGRKVTIDLDNNHHMKEHSELYKESVNTEKGNLIAKVGEYKYNYGGRDIRDITNNRDGKNPIKIHQRGEGLGVQGQLYYWDSEKGAGSYVDIQRDLIDANQLPIWGSPEELEAILDDLMFSSQAQYDYYEPNVSL